MTLLDTLEGMTSRWTDEVNSYQEEGSKIEHHVSLFNSLNARAEKLVNGYRLTMNSGILEKSFQIIGENIDYYLKKYDNELDKEFYIAIGCNILWTAIYGHELGHILRGHLEYLESHASNAIDEIDTFPALTVHHFDEFPHERTRLLMEFDADVFGARFIAKQVSLLEKKASSDSIGTKGIIVDIAVSSLYFLFNEQCKLEGASTKYPKAFIRLNCLLNFMVDHLASETSMRKDEAQKTVNESAFGVNSFLVDNNYHNQGTSSDELATLDENERNILIDYSRFNEIISGISTNPCSQMQST